MSEHVLTTKIEFADRFEGQVLHRGSKEECLSLSDMMPAVMLRGSTETPLSASHLIVEADKLDMQAGELWRCSKPGFAAAPQADGAPAP